MKKHIVISVICLISLFASVGIFDVNESGQAKASYRNANDGEPSTSIDEVIDELDLSALEAYISTLTEKQKEFLSGKSAKDFIKSIIDGNAIDFGSIMGFLFSTLGANLSTFLPLMAVLIAVAIGYSIINSVKGKFASDSVEGIIRFACNGIIIVLLMTQIFFTVDAAVKMIGALKAQTDIVFPILLTLMTAIGAGASVNVYRPAVLIFSSGIINLITAIAIPLFLISLVFTAVGSISKGIKLKEMSSFFSTVTKWILNTTFFLFMAFLSIQGITASVYDGISIRTTKFALSKYVPVIGGYLSEGFNLILAGSVLIKNSLGLTAIILLLFTVVPYIVQIALLSLTLRLTAAVLEPLGSGEIAEVVGGFGKNLNLLISMILGIGFLYFVFIMLVIATGNLSL